MTVMERLRAAGAAEDEAQRAAGTIGGALPVDRQVRITDEVLDAARAGDVTLVALLLAEEVAAELDEITALDELERGRRGAERFSAAGAMRNADVKKLVDISPPRYRLRVGRYRAILALERDRIIVERILDRRDAYR